MKADDIDMVTTDIEIVGWFIVMKKYIIWMLPLVTASSGSFQGIEAW